jgi:hypothetical protein
VIGLVVTVLALTVWWAAERPPVPDGSADRASGRAAPAIGGRSQTRQTGPPPAALPERPAPDEAPSRPSPAAGEVEETIRRIFAAFNAQDLEAFLTGWTPRGFQHAFEFPITQAIRLESDLFAESGPYTIDGFANTVVGPHGAGTHVDMTNGQRKERHRMTLVKHAGAWKIDLDEKLPARPPGKAVPVDVSITGRSLEVSTPEVVSDSVAFRVANADDTPHQLVVMRRVVESGVHQALGHVGPLQPGQHATLVLTDLVPGPYLLVCNMLDRDGQPYSSKGLRAELTIR